MDLKIGYNTDVDDIINDFYIPVLSSSKSYKRIVGYFNSGSLASVSKGLKNFILNGGIMELICGSNLDSDDINVIYKSSTSLKDVISKKFIEDLDNLSKDGNDIIYNRLQILGWMIAHDQLKIKIAIKKDENGNLTSEGILHSKVAIFEDFESNKISFNGSNNETYAALNNNFEQFDVFNSWNSESKKHLRNHQQIFDSFWNENINTYKIMSIPEAVEKKLISYAPKSFSELKFTSVVEKKKVSSKVRLFDYQKEARNNWFQNDKKGIFAMATGTGKTFTALSCLDKLLDNEDKLVVIISAPYQHLVQQWKKSIEKYGLMRKINKLVIVDSSNPNGKMEMANNFFQVAYYDQKNVVIITTHNSLSSKKFIDIIYDSDLNCKTFLIADEMHGLGANKFKLGLLDYYDYRLGLSATPERVYDEVGTDFLKSYFDKIIFEFPLKDALRKINPLTNLTYLTPYKYYPCFVNLNNDELESYGELTEKIIKIMNIPNSDQQLLEHLIRKRSNILKNAVNKYDVLSDILDDLGKDVSDLIIYCSDKQLETVIKIVGIKHNLKIRKFTMKEKATISKKWGYISEREHIINLFTKGDYQCLVAIKCLDEGVDIPSASKAILMCNSTNPREFIQRLGRVLRRYESKDISEIYDLVLKPQQKYNWHLYAIEKEIYDKELNRCEHIVELAENRFEAEQILYK